jgi:hypothetical protein
MRQPCHCWSQEATCLCHLWPKSSKGRERATPTVDSFFNMDNSHTQVKANACGGLESAWSCLPHPVKAYRGGEDVHMVVNIGQISLVGVFDGVGGWADLGIDSAMYAREIARIIEVELRKDPDIWQSTDKPLMSLLETVSRLTLVREMPLCSLFLLCLEYSV